MASEAPIVPPRSKHLTGTKRGHISMTPSNVKTAPSLTPTKDVDGGHGSLRYKSPSAQQATKRHRGPPSSPLRQMSSRLRTTTPKCDHVLLFCQSLCLEACIVFSLTDTGWDHCFACVMCGPLDAQYTFLIQLQTFPCLELSDGLADHHFRPQALHYTQSRRNLDHLRAQQSSPKALFYHLIDKLLYEFFRSHLPRLK